MHDLHLPGLNRDDLLPRQPEGMGRGLILALVAHVLLVIAIAFNVHWNSSDPAGREAELWSTVPQVAAQRSAPPEPEPQPEPPPKPEPKPVPKPVEAPPPPKPLPDPQIAIDKEKARQDKLKEEKRREEEQVKREKAEHQKREEAKKLDEKKQLEEKRQLEERKLEEKKLAEKKKQDAAKAQAQADAQREAQLKRILAQAGAENGSPAGKSAQSTGGASSSYAGRIRAAVEPNITFTSELSGNPAAEVEVRQGPDGTILGSRLVKSSGVREWDEAVLRAVDKTQKLPRDIDGRVISPVIMTFRPNK